MFPQVKTRTPRDRTVKINIGFTLGPILNNFCEGWIVSDWCIYIANLFYLASFVGRDMLWLRLLTCCGLVFGIVFFCAQSTPMYGPAGWHVAFLIINAFQIHHLINERKRLRLSKEQEEVAKTYRGLSDKELVDSLTHSMVSDKDDAKILTKNNYQTLEMGEKAFRDIAFSRLSREELINLLVRRMSDEKEEATSTDLTPPDIHSNS
ncbi:popeye domain-containing protein [Planctomicrobium sp.]|nr:hypothetical protein [Planctomicrobium sp.]MDB4732802.1 popeye domain-containing protein [Planctomicrobium sp.]